MSYEENKLLSLLKKQDIDNLFLEATNYLCQTKSLFEEKEQLQQENEHLDEVNCKLRKANKQLKDNWNELRKQEINRFNKTQDVQFLDVLQDMQEIESENRNG